MAAAAGGCYLRSLEGGFIQVITDLGEEGLRREGNAQTGCRSERLNIHHRSGCCSREAAEHSNLGEEIVEGPVEQIGGCPSSRTTHEMKMSKEMFSNNLCLH